VFSGVMRVETTMQAADAPRHVLVVDDSRAQRHMVSMQLHRWGYRVSECDSGLAALDLCRTQSFDIILSDWMMPGMTGLEFCREFRALDRESYGYFILLTSKSEKTEIADGLEAGADDFLTKPVASNELRARLRAGERMLAMQAEVLAKNKVISSTLAELQKLYDSLDRDLIEARKLQQTLVRDRVRDYGWSKVSLLLRNSGRVGGDLVGSFRRPDRGLFHRRLRPRRRVGNDDRAACRLSDRLVTRAEPRLRQKPGRHASPLAARNRGRTLQPPDARRNPGRTILYHRLRGDRPRARPA
jgi:DNA-binding response OmpR family regulator